MVDRCLNRCARHFSYTCVCECACGLAAPTGNRIYSGEPLLIQTKILCAAYVLCQIHILWYSIPFNSIWYFGWVIATSWWSEGARHAHNVHRLRTERTCECACIVCDISISESKWLSLLDRIFSTQYTNSIPQVFEQNTSKQISI